MTTRTMLWGVVYGGIMRQLNTMQTYESTRLNFCQSTSRGGTMANT
jgi:hypothetical protein